MPPLVLRRRRARTGVDTFEEKVKEALKMTEKDRANVQRVAIWLEGGASAPNLEKICRALKVTPKCPKRKNWNLAAIEVKLRGLGFKQYNTFIPTAHHMTLSEDAFHLAMQGEEMEGYPGEYWSVAYSIKEMCEALGKFMATKGLPPAAEPPSPS